MSMTELLLVLNLFITLVVAILVVVRRRGDGRENGREPDSMLFGAELSKIGPLLRDELTRSGEEGLRTSRETREELGTAVKSSSDSLMQHFQSLLIRLGVRSTDLTDRLAAVAKTNEDKFGKLILANDANLKENSQTCFGNRRGILSSSFCNELSGQKY